MLKQIILSGLIVLFLVIGLAGPASVQAYDLRAQKLEAFFEKYKSPLADEAYTFVAEADKNKLDYRLLPAIAGVESTFAKKYVVGTYNAWGWGGGYIPFRNWGHAIASISTQLTQRPYRGVEPDLLAPIYCPPSSGSWAWKVKYFMNQIEATQIYEKPTMYLAMTL